MRIWGAMVLWCLAAIVGCGGPSTVPAGGVITYNGKPVADANVVFTPVGGAEDALAATGQTDAQGKFSLSTEEPGDGAVPGEYKVTVTPKASIPAEGDYSIPTAPPFPQRYSDPGVSELTETVTSGQDNQFTLELKD